MPDTTVLRGPRRQQRSLLTLLGMALIALLVGGFLALGSGSSAYGADPDAPDCNYRDGDNNLVECYSNCFILICPSAYTPPIMADMPGTAGDLLAVPPDIVFDGMYPSVYSVDDDRVAGVGTVSVTNVTTYIWDAVPFYVQLTWTMTFTDDPFPFADECGIEDDFFTTPADVSWASPTTEWILVPLATIDLVHTVLDDRVDGVGLVTVTATATTNVGAGPVVTTQSWELTFTNAACGGVTSPPGLAITGASAGVPAIAGLLLLTGGALVFMIGQRRSRARAR